MKLALILLGFAAFANAGIMKRQAQNSYGDEQNTPAPAAPAESYQPAPVEQPSAPVEQPAAEAPAAPSASSGYRSKRQAQNSYGDEQATPAPAPEAPAEPAPEQPAAEVSQSAPAEAPVASSGYRSRRQAQNSYGDEQATPAPAPEAPAEPAPEQPAAEVSQSAPAEAPVASSGYRSRRQAQNSYGDEQNTPAPAAPAESYQPAPVEQPSAPVEQPAAEAPAAPSASSGYRSKRQAQNSYGDEQATPAPAPEAPAEPAPEQPAAEVSQSAPAEAPVASSGYRSRRQAQNSYGDEQATPAPAAPAESYQPAPAEQPAAAVAQEAPAEAPAPVASSGYRS